MRNSNLVVGTTPLNTKRGYVKTDRRQVHSCETMGEKPPVNAHTLSRSSSIILKTRYFWEGRDLLKTSKQKNTVSVESRGLLSVLSKLLHPLGALTSFSRLGFLISRLSKEPCGWIVCSGSNPQEKTLKCGACNIRRLRKHNLIYRVSLNMLPHLSYFHAV
jgi:hypothetical protein